MQQSNQMPALLEQIRRAPGLVEGLPAEEGAIVRGALAGKSVYEIAADCQTSESNVWHVLGRVARDASGAEIHPVETGGLGSLGDEPDLSVPDQLADGRDFHNLAAEQSPQERPARTPQTLHPSQAEGDDAEDSSPVQVPQTPHPSQAEGDEEAGDESLRARERGRR